MKNQNGMLDPLLAPALKLAELPVLPGRREADAVAGKLVELCERIAVMAHAESNVESALQLTNVAEAMGVAVISLTAYARGRVPKVSRKPNLIVHS